MLSYIPGLPTTALHESTFVGIHRELCFVPDWLPRDQRGYARLHAQEFPGHDQDGRSMSAHRLAFMLLQSPLENGDNDVLHRCGNARCHNPHHLYAAGGAENRNDAALHRQAEERWGPLGLAFKLGEHSILMPQPLVLSREASRLPASFTGFSCLECLHCDWLYPTHDGFRQLRNTSKSGHIVGAHRRMYALFNGPLDRYDIVSHTCGDSTCLNPYHLIVSGRQPDPLDFDVEHDKRFKLTKWMLDLIRTSPKSNRELANDLGVHPGTVYIRRRLMQDEPLPTESDADRP